MPLLPTHSTEEAPLASTGLSRAAITALASHTSVAAAAIVPSSQTAGTGTSAPKSASAPGTPLLASTSPRRYDATNTPFSTQLAKVITQLMTEIPRDLKKALQTGKSLDKWAKKHHEFNFSQPVPDIIKNHTYQFGFGKSPNGMRLSA